MSLTIASHYAQGKFIIPLPYFGSPSQELIIFFQKKKKKKKK